MSFLSEFCAYGKSRSDCPPDFHLHAGMVALAAALGNGVWCDGWHRPIYPNLWCVNIAPSGYGKSVSLDLAESMIEQANLSDRKLPGSFSQEGLIRHIAEHPQGTWFLQEFSSFLSVIDRGYNDGTQQWLTEAFDVPAEMPRVLSNERIVLRKPCISILGASSPSWFASVYQESALRGGFLARFLFCPSSTPGEYVGHPGPRELGMEAALAWHIQKVSRLEGRFDLGPVMRDFREWDESCRVALRKDCPPEFSGMRSRAGLLVLKCVMLFAVSEDPELMVARPKHLTNAIKYIESAHAKAEKFLTEEVAQDKAELARMRIVEIMVRMGGQVQWSALLKRSKMSAGPFKEAINTLREAGYVTTRYQDGAQYVFLIPSEFPEISLAVPQSSPNGTVKSGEVGGISRELEGNGEL